MEINYITEGEEGEQCKDCKNFKSTEEGKGDCFGHEVLEEGHCNHFKENNF